MQGIGVLHEDSISKVEAMVYLVISPNDGPEHRTYCDEDLQAIGGVHALECSLERESYWFAYLGQIFGRRDSDGDTFSDAEFARLAEPEEWALKTGRLNPAFDRSDIEKRVFREVFRAVEHELDSWKQRDGVTVDAYALKELKIAPSRLVALTNGLVALQRVHELVEVTVVKFWYDPQYQAKPMPLDLVLAEFSFRVPIQIEWAPGEGLLSVKLMAGASC